MQNIYDIDTIGYNDGLGTYTNFQVNNTFYMLAPPYYSTFYNTYLRKALQVYDGYDSHWHSVSAGLVPERLAQSVAQGLTNMLFAHGIDFVGDERDYLFVTDWAKKSHLCEFLKKAHIFSAAGGTAILKLNREGKHLYASAHRIDTFYPEFASDGSILSAKIYFDLVENTNFKTGADDHYGICEERYYNEYGKACVRCSVYRCGGNLQTSVSSRPTEVDENAVKWENLPPRIKQYIKRAYPSILIGKEQYLPFAKSLGLYAIRFTVGIPQIPDMKFGQPLGDIIHTECTQFDQLKYFEKNEVDLARARALIPEEMWNKDDPLYGDRALSDRFYQKISSLGNDDDKITPIQFAMRASDIRTQKENIYRDVAAKLNVSASSVASFLSDGAGAMTATQITSEKTKTATWIANQAEMLSNPINELLSDVMRYYNRLPVTIVFKSEEQTPELDTVKTYTDMFSQGAISPDLFVKKVHRNLTEAQQAREIAFLKERIQLKQMQALQPDEAIPQGNAQREST